MMAPVVLLVGYLTSMRIRINRSLILFFCLVGLFACTSTGPDHATDGVGVRAPSAIIAESTPAEWRTPNPESLLILSLPQGDVFIELAPDLAPAHVRNFRQLVRERYYDGLWFYRVVEGFVAQAGAPEDAKPIQNAQRTIDGEFFWRGDLGDEFTVVDSEDGFAADSGYWRGFPVARNAARTEAWLTHCPGAFAMARGNEPDSGGATFYIVIGHAPRYLDRNTTVFGRVLYGLEYVQQLRRGYGPSGVIQDPVDYNPINSLRLAADLAEDQRVNVEVMRTDSAAFKELIQARANRPEDWFYERPGYVDLCGVPVPVRIGD